MYKKVTFPQFKPSKLVTYILPLITTSVVLSVRYATDPHLYHGPFTLFALLVIFHSYIGGFKSGILTTSIAVFMGNYYLMQPIKYIKLEELEYLVPTLLFLLESVIIVLFVELLNKNKDEIKTIAHSLITTKEQFKDVIDSIFNFIIITDNKGVVLEANEAFAKTLPNKWKDLVGNNILELPIWKNKKNIKLRLKNAVKSAKIGRPIYYQDKIKFLNNIINAEVNVFASSLDNNQKIDNYIITITDATTKVLYAEEIEKGQKIFTKLIESNIIGMVISDGDGTIQNANAAFLNLVGFTKTDIKAKKLSWNQIIPNITNLAETKHLQKIYKAGFLQATPKTLIKKNKETVSAMISGVLLDKKRNIALTLVVDLTEQKKLENKKLEFMSIVSHELKTPITVLKGYIQILQQRLSKEKNSYTRFLSEINNQINKLTEQINELHDINKIQMNMFKINKKEFDIVSTIKRVVDEAKPFTEGHVIKLKTVYKRLKINADEPRLEQVLLNLITNAIKYSKPDSKINIYISKQNELLKVTVEDFGKGIPEDDIEKVFTKFYQAEDNSEQREGLGLGLYIASQIINKHNGEVEVESELGVGSKFSFLLPLN